MTNKYSVVLTYKTKALVNRLGAPSATNLWKFPNQPTSRAHFIWIASKPANEKCLHDTTTSQHQQSNKSDFNQTRRAHFQLGWYCWNNWFFPDSICSPAFGFCTDSQVITCCWRRGRLGWNAPMGQNRYSHVTWKYVSIYFWIIKWESRFRELHIESISWGHSTLIPPMQNKPIG